MEEYEAATREDAGTDPGTKLEGDRVPEEVRGKTVDDVLSENRRLQETLRLRDAEAATLRSALDRPTPAAAAPAPAPAPEPELTREQLLELHQNDPLAAIDYMNQQAIRRAEAAVAARLGTIEAGTMSMAEQQARSEFADEFELFGPDIQRMVDSIPNKAVFNTKKGWADAVSFVRGQPGNFEKLLDKRTGSLRTPEEAREEQRSNTPRQPRSTKTAPVGEKRLSPQQKEIAAGLGMSEAEYLKWERVGQ
jgi:hypothetical protein